MKRALLSSQPWSVLVVPDRIPAPLTAAQGYPVQPALPCPGAGEVYPPHVMREALSRPAESSTAPIPRPADPSSPMLIPAVQSSTPGARPAQTPTSCPGNRLRNDDCGRGCDGAWFENRPGWQNIILYGRGNRGKMSPISGTVWGTIKILKGDAA